MADTSYQDWRRSNPGGSLARYARENGIPYTTSTHGGFLTRLFNNVGGVLPLVAPFLGPAGGAVASLAGGLLQSGRDSKTANAYTDKAAGLGEQEAQIAALQMPLLKALMGNAGFDPTTGTYNPDFIPNEDLANRLFNPSSVNGMAVAGREAGAPAADSAVNQIRADFLRRGFGGGANTGADSAIADVRFRQGADNANYQRGLLTDLANQKRNFLLGNLGQAKNSLNNALGFSSNSAQGALGTFGGLQGFYQNRADQTQQGIGTAVGELAKSGTLAPVVDNVSSWLKGRFGLGNRTRPGGIPKVATPPIVGGYVPQRSGGVAGSVGWGI